MKTVHRRVGRLSIGSRSSPKSHRSPQKQVHIDPVLHGAKESFAIATVSTMRSHISDTLETGRAPRATPGTGGVGALTGMLTDSLGSSMSRMF